MIRLALACGAATAFAWSAFVWLTGGATIAIAGLRVSSTDPIRPLLVALVLAAAYVAGGGRRHIRTDAALAAAVATPSRVAALLAIAAALVAVRYSSWTASGADAYAYVTQADLWLRGTLKVPVPMAEDVPWPRAVATFVPFGYAAVAGESAIASAVGPGLPLLMAVFKALGGHAALFLVVPITAALLVWCVFAIGRAIRSPSIGLGAAWLAATSPAFLTMVKEPMSDVPAAAFWALATWKVLDRSRFGLATAGIAAGVAILVRPNLVPMAAVLAAWVLRTSRGETHVGRLRRLAMFGAGIVAACLAVAVINTSLFGSPLSSGYGATGSLFAIGNVLTNAERYGRWLAETQTPLAFAGLAALLVPAGRLWPTADALRAARVLAALAAVVCAMYALYLPFDAWWFLRLLLPIWPAMCVGIVVVIAAASDFAGARSRQVCAAALLALGLYTASVAGRLDVFPDSEGERRYATIAQLVQHATEPSSVIFASIHAGPLRYYAGRDTIRFDLLDEAWLDRAVAWLTEHGRRPYFLVEDWERPIFEQRFTGMNALGRLALSPVMAYRAYQIPGTVYLFDPARPAAATLEPAPIRDPQPRCPMPAALPPLALKPAAANF